MINHKDIKKTNTTSLLSNLPALSKVPTLFILATPWSGHYFHLHPGTLRLREMTLSRPRPRRGEGRVGTPTFVFCFQDPKVSPPHRSRPLRRWLTQQQSEWLFLCSTFLHQKLVSQLIPGQSQVNWVGSNRQTMLALRVQLPYACPGLQQTSSRRRLTFTRVLASPLDSLLLVPVLTGFLAS